MQISAPKAPKKSQGGGYKKKRLNSAKAGEATRSLACIKKKPLKESSRRSHRYLIRNCTEIRPEVLTQLMLCTAEMRLLLET